MPDKITEFTAKLDDMLKKSDVALYFIQIENLPMLTLAYGHLEANSHIQKLAEKINGTCIRTDQIILAEVDNGKAGQRMSTEKIKKLFHESDTHVAITITRQIIKSGSMDANSAIAEIYADSLRENALFSVSNKQDLNHRINESREQMKLANQIKEALKSKSFKLVYQPIIESKTGNISHYEALLRLESGGELKSAGNLIMAAEKMGLIDAIDVYVLDAAVSALKANPNLRLAFNISSLTISNREWIKSFFDSITPDVGKRMVIEITETAALKNLRETAYFIATMQDTGCMFALDDFGSGYTSFRQIRALSFDYVKLDGSLIIDIATNSHNRLLVKSLLDYMKSQNIKTVAEFVENGETAKILMEFGIDLMQGNYFGEPAKVAV